MLPKVAVLLRDGDSFALRPASEGELALLMRRVTIGSRGSGAAMCIGEHGTLGDRFQVVAQGDLFLLKPLEPFVNPLGEA